MSYNETIISIHVQTKAPHEAISSLVTFLAEVEHLFAERGEGYIKVEIFNNEIEKIEKKDCT